MISSSKKDWWARYLAPLAALGLIAGGAWMIWSGFEFSIMPGEMIVVQLQRSYFMSLLSLLMPLFGVMLLWMLASTEYEITPERLVLQCGPSRTCIPLTAIEKAIAVDRPWRGGLARGPAWSFDMLRVDYRRANGKPASPVVISPRDRELFLSWLASSIERREEARPETPADGVE